MAEKQGPMKIFFISLIILFITVSISAMLDWQVMSHSQYDLNNSVEYIEFENYAFWFGLSMSMPGIAISVVTCAIYWSVKGVRVMLPVAVLACTLILLISGLEDLIYFALGANGFPAANMNWNWLLQSRLFGFWNTTIHVIWTAFWVLFAIPMVSFVLHRKMQRSKSSRL